MFACVVGAPFLFVKFLFGPSAAVVEGTGGIDAMKRSWNLTKGHFWRVLGFYLLAYILVYIVTLVISAPFAIFAFIGGPSAWAIAAVGNSLGGLISTPFLVIIAVQMYFDIRVRKEGLDIQMMTQELAQPQ